jgi:hypothetical protein
MVASMYADVAVQAGTIKGPIFRYSIYRLIRLVCPPRIELTRMSLVGMTPLAEIGCLTVQKGHVWRSMRGMASETILNRWGMFAKVWSPYIGMAFQALQIHVLRIHQLIGNGAVRVMTIPALDLSFSYRMTGPLKHLDPNRFMTLEAYFYFRGF